MDIWLIQHVTFLGIIPMQNWMLVSFAIALIAALFNVAEMSGDL